MKSRICLCLLLFITYDSMALQVSSPDGNIVVSVFSDNDIPHYQISYRNKAVILPSGLGLVFKQQGEFSQGFLISGSTRHSHEETWRQPWGERKNVRDKHNELLVNFTRNSKANNTFSVRFRVFDDGVGFRYEVPKQPGLQSVEIVDENTEFFIPDSEQSTAWWITSRGWNRYEYLYQTTSVSSVDRAHTPFTFKLPSGVHLSIHEAALVDYAAMSLDQGRSGVFKADLAPWSDGVRVKTKTAFHSPWRTIHISPDAVGLVNSDLILNLNEPNKLGDVSWVKPAKYLGIWWGMHLKKNTWGSGDSHGATTSETIRYIDFAAQHGFDGVLVEGWNVGWDGEWYGNGDVFNFTKAYPDFDIQKISAYGKKKNVRLIGHHETAGNVTNYRNQMGDAFDFYQKHGVTQVKTGYVADGGKIKRVDDKGLIRYEWHDGQFMVNEYLHSVKEAAKRKISINTHEPIKDTGLRRTYPNWITREGARGQEYNAWGSPPNSPEHTAILPYTRLLSGPMDFTPGIFDLAPDGLEAQNRVRTTLAKQLALYVVIYSPLQMAADLPINYKANPKAFKFIKDVPCDWEESKAIAGEVGDFIVMVRQERDKKDWYLGALTDEHAREINITLDFLDPNETYSAQIYKDGPNANWESRPFDLLVEKKRVKHSDKLRLLLASSGGTAIRFRAL